MNPTIIYQHILSAWLKHMGFELRKERPSTFFAHCKDISQTHVKHIFAKIMLLLDNIPVNYICWYNIKVKFFSFNITTNTQTQIMSQSAPQIHHVHTIMEGAHHQVCQRMRPCACKNNSWQSVASHLLFLLLFVLPFFVVCSFSFSPM